MSTLDGKTGELLRWVLGSVVAILVSYYTAAISTEQRLTNVETTQRLNFDELQRSLTRIEIDVRDVKLSLTGSFVPSFRPSNPSTPAFAPEWTTRP